ncbi:MAG: hypothetical protein ABJB05_01135 [Parafilimonas sp.]
MKRSYITCLYFLICFVTSAQSNTGISSSLNFTPQSQLKATIRLNNNTVTKGVLTQITDSTIVLSISSQNENSIIYTGSTISIKEIKFIKIKRHAFFLGMACGAVVTGFVGYAIGRGSYTDDPLVSGDENENNANLKGYKGALIGVVPGAVIGSIIGSIAVKRKFIINGNMKNIRSMMKTLWQFSEHT